VLDDPPGKASTPCGTSAHDITARIQLLSEVVPADA